MISFWSKLSLSWLQMSPAVPDVLHFDAYNHVGGRLFLNGGHLFLEWNVESACAGNISSSDAPREILRGWGEG